MKKYIFIILCCLSFSSCRTLHPSGIPYMSDIYICPGNIVTDGYYLILREQPKVFEMQYCGRGDWGSITLGEWSITNDTLYLHPRYESNDGVVVEKLWKVSQNDLTIFTIPQKFIIKRDKVIQQIDYGALGVYSVYLTFPPDFSEIDYLRVPMKSSKFRRKYNRLKRTDTWKQASPIKKKMYKK